ncbi:MAG: P1 family peptidase [Firmicutes bacterium]|nr:P1 family peptidase [Bacillota bacterium]
MDGEGARLAEEALWKGPLNAITDVEGVRVGHVTLVRGEGRLVPGRGPVRTGVTVIVPGEGVYERKFVAGAHVINGFGKAVGLPQLVELGRLETPIGLTNTLCVWRAAEALAEAAIRENPGIGVRGPTVNPVVGECNDGYLNDIQGMHVRKEDVALALERASAGPVEEGAVGAGTGMVCYGWKGGIGSASRRWRCEALDREVTLGALVLANFGRPQDLVIDGFPAGHLLAEVREEEPRAGEGGSVIVVYATDAPLTSRQLTRVARRAAAGLARTGSVYHHGSGDFALAFSTARAYPPYLPDEGHYLNPFFLAAAETAAEAVWRALAAARAMTGRDGRTVDALPVERVRELAARRGLRLPSLET